MSTRINVGDRVTCNDAKGLISVRYGEMYTVSWINFDHTMLRVKGSIAPFSASRFKKVGIKTLSDEQRLVIDNIINEMI